MRMLWFKFRDSSRRLWRVELVDKLVHEDTGETIFGLTVFDRRSILILASQSASDLADTVIHELMHAAGGIRARSDMEYVAEEHFIRRSSRGMWRIMSGLGMRLPPLPDGFKIRRSRRPKAV